MIRAHYWIAPALAGCLLAPTVALAEDEPIVVTGRGLAETPATPAYDVVRIDRERINSTASGRIEDLLSSVAGFQQFRRSDSRSSNPSAQGVTLRALGGNATSRALVLLDGVPMADPMFGYIPLSAIAPERLGAVRVTRGGGSGAFGSGAVAGTIELTSANAQELGLFSGEALVDDRGETTLSGTLAPELGQGFAVVSGRWDRGQGFWTTPKGQRVPASVKAKYDSWSTSVRMVAPLTDDIEVQARGLLFEDNRVLRFAGATTSASGQDASIRLVGRGDWQFDVLAYVQARDFSNVVISSTAFRKTLDQRRTPSTGLGGKIELRPPVGDAHVLRFGADLRVGDAELQEEGYNATTGAVTVRRRAGGRNTDVGLFVEDDWTLGPVVLTAGLRADRWTIREGFLRETSPAGVVTTNNLFGDRQGWDTSLRGGAVWNAGGGLALRAAGYSGIRMPTVNELYRPFVVFPVTTQANAALRNEDLRGVDVGIDFTPSPAVTLSVTAFYNKVENAIANVTIATNTRQRQNVGAVRAKGLEFGAALRFGTVSLDGSLALTDAEVQTSGAQAALDGLRPAQTPKVAASATLAWRPQPGWTFSTTLRHVGAQFEDDLQVDSLRAATTLDAYVELPVTGPFSLVLRGENLTDTEIVTRNQAGSIDVGVPRTLWAGVKVRVK
ncbi:TonB-dependent receptor [Novosphingobium sp. JCM 18896]|uniref:TonB-dependent receptor n=1 Tax=Novosphingobium sp. JCM 18896 TaxID=2989731 RepID=UPI002221B8BC|nr:TonB-dependent receptor [Novosphingobium sp. JCM 18896]MCW1428680.1 TonB-dependent receptor [Novosphingobium sp. JCM 18896]